MSAPAASVSLDHTYCDECFPEGVLPTVALCGTQIEADAQRVETGFDLTEPCAVCFGGSLRCSGCGRFYDL